MKGQIFFDQILSLLVITAAILYFLGNLPLPTKSPEEDIAEQILELLVLSPGYPYYWEYAINVTLPKTFGLAKIEKTPIYDIIYFYRKISNSTSFTATLPLLGNAYPYDGDARKVLLVYNATYLQHFNYPPAAAIVNENVGRIAIFPNIEGLILNNDTKTLLTATILWLGKFPKNKIIIGVVDPANLQWFKESVKGEVIIDDIEVSILPEVADLSNLQKYDVLYISNYSQILSYETQILNYYNEGGGVLITENVTQLDVDKILYRDALQIMWLNDTFLGNNVTMLNLNFSYAYPMLEIDDQKVHAMKLICDQNYLYVLRSFNLKKKLLTIKIGNLTICGATPKSSANIFVREAYMPYKDNLTKIEVILW